MSYYKERALSTKLERLFATFKVVVISGARQVGKTELVKRLFGQVANIVTFDPLIDVGGAKEDPELFLNNQKTPLILDEIQYVPHLAAVIKRKVDSNSQPGQYILTGSQQWEVMKNLSESLAGRAVFLDLDSFMLSEEDDLYRETSYRPWLVRWLEEEGSLEADLAPKLMQKNLFHSIWTGSLPQATQLSPDVLSDFHAGYIRTYIERDVRLILSETDPTKFRRFYQLAAALSAQEINYSEFGRELGVDYKVAQKWIGILRSTFQWHDIPAYFNNAVKRISKKPKGIFADTGLACHLLAISKPDVIAGHPMYGRLFETFMTREIMKQASLLQAKPHFYHWRSHKNEEVDLIIDYNGVLYPIEMKGKSNPNKGDLRGITAFRKSHTKSVVGRGLLVSAGERIYPLTDMDWVAPWNMV